MDKDVPCKVIMKDGKQVIDLAHGVKLTNSAACGSIVAYIEEPKASRHIARKIIVYILIKLNNFLEKNPTD